MAKSRGSQFLGGNPLNEAYRAAKRKKRTGQLTAAGIATCDQNSFIETVVAAFSKAAANDQWATAHSMSRR